MELTNDQKKLEIVSRLVKEGVIDFEEAIALLEKDQPPVFIYPTQPFDWTYPFGGLPPLPNPIWKHDLWEVTCQTQN